jgi:hypothetical protein
MTFTAYEGGRVTHMKRIKKSSILLTIGVRSFEAVADGRIYLVLMLC